ncbi:carbohydrate-binding protein [Cohnella suwonensis]|uniref:Carbohydrate-binding protein n=1 Tax=Cohnella suwonensis TaxID=696072 RepID=A0ABW0LN57_9BACL
MSKKFKRHTSVFTMICMMFTMVFVLSPVEIVSAANTTYYVDSVAGDDSNDGTSTSTPWKTLSKVNATAFGPGDNILFKYNSTWTGQLKVTSSGASGNPIVIGSYGGTSSKPIIAGSVGNELLSDPGFENATSGWVVNSPFSIQTDAANARTGTKSLKLVAAGGYENTYKTSVAVNPNTNYNFTAYIKGSGKVMLRVYNNNWSTILATRNFTATSNWTQVNLTVPSGANTSVKPMFTDSTGGGGTIYIDDASLVSSTEAPVLLDNVSYVTVDGLELTNDAAFEGLRSGIKITSNSGSGTKYGITIKNNDIHNIKGFSSQSNASHPDPYNKYFNAGIYMSPNTDFDGITIDNNYIHDSSAQGFYDNAPVTPVAYRMYNLLLQNNTITNVSGNPITVQGAETPLIQNNRAINGGINAIGGVAVAGIWALHTNNATFQYNYVEGTKRLQYDGEPWDFDYGMGGTNVYQYNYSRNNEGGFILYVDQVNNPTLIARYNISQNDGLNQDFYQGFFSLGNGVPIYFYNNVFYQSPANSYGFPFNQGRPNGLGDFKNNIFYTNATSYITYANGTYRTFSNNSFYGHTPVNPGSSYITADPLLVNPGSGGTDIHSVSGYRLQAGSPLRNAGVSIASNGGKDYWGNSLYNGTPDIGAHEYYAPTEYQAENAALSGGMVVQSDHTGYTGTGFAGGYWSIGATTTFTVNVASAGSKNVELRYANGRTSARTISIYVNGTKIKQTSLPFTTNWDTWGLKPEELTLLAGNNTISYKYDSGDTGLVNIDKITVTP